MRNVSKFFHIVVLATIAAVLVVAVPASPALAARSIELDPEEGEIGEWIDIDGYDFPPSYYNSPTDYYDSYVDIYFSSDEAVVGYDIDDEVNTYKRVKSGVWVSYSGAFSNQRFTVPTVLTVGSEDVYGGPYYVSVTYTGSKRIRAVADFKVIAGEIELGPVDGPVGTEVEISGAGFADDEDITVEYGGDEVDIASGDDETDSDGEFTCHIIIPESTKGKHTITVSDESGSEAEADFTVKPHIAFASASGAVGDKVTVNGTGFRTNRSITVTFDNDEVQTTPSSLKSDDNGSFSGVFIIPSCDNGIHEVEASDGINEADANFSVSAGISLSPAVTQASPGHVGTELTVKGTGFTPSATVTITYATEPIVVATTTADANGKFSATFTVPKSNHGQHTITAYDGTNTVTAIFTMESAPPTIPLPLLPQMGVKTESQPYFDWEDVTDPSGVTYALQVATDEEFTTESMVLEKTDLTESEYTLTKEERLESTSKEAPYYWRVRAVDGASNMSGWSGTGSFHVGFTFQLTGWVLYTLIGIVGLLLLAFVYLMGKRRATY